MNKLLLFPLFCLVMSVPAFAGDQDFTLINDTGVEIAELYVSPTSANDWEEDVLAADTLPDGESAKVHFSRDEAAVFWDLKIVDGDGNSVEWDKLKLTGISHVTLTIENGDAVATYE